MASEVHRAKRAKKVDKHLSEIAFYLFLAAFLGWLLVMRVTGVSYSFGGYSAFTVLTGSMQSEIPQGSLVITKQVDPQKLEVGDDITYMANETTTITHRIIGITENHMGTGKRAFETKGIMNSEPDKQLVPEVNVIGKVVFHSLAMGKTVNFVKKNWPIIIFLLLVAVVFSGIIKRILKSGDEEEEDEANDDNDRTSNTSKKRIISKRGKRHGSKET